MSDRLTWRKSSFSGSNGDCVEVAEVGDRVAIRNSRHPERGNLDLAPDAVVAFIAWCSDGELDDLGR